MWTIDSSSAQLVGVTLGRTSWITSYQPTSPGRARKLRDMVSSQSTASSHAEMKDQVEQLRISERDFENLGQIGDGQFGSVSYTNTDRLRG